MVYDGINLIWYPTGTQESKNQKLQCKTHYVNFWVYEWYIDKKVISNCVAAFFICCEVLQSFCMFSRQDIGVSLLLLFDDLPAC